MRRRAGAVLPLMMLLAGCGGPPTSPSSTAATEDPDGCRPALAPDDPHPVADGPGGQHPDLSGDWFGPLAEAVHTDAADVTGGLWLDQAAGEVVVMLPPNAPAGTLDELRATVDHPERVVCMEATWTSAQLEELLREAMSLTTGPASGGIDTVRNRIELTVEVDAEQLRDELAARFDDATLAAFVLDVPACAEIADPPSGATALPGGGSTCGGMDALFTGQLVGDGTCAWAETDGGEPIAFVWPRGWWLDAEGVVYDHHGEPLAAIGDPIESGGGFVPSAEDACGPPEVEHWLVASLSGQG